MKVGYLSGTQYPDELQREMSALKRLGCERIIVGDGWRDEVRRPVLEALLGDLSEGDMLFVWSLDDVADSLGELVAFVLQLERRNVCFRALADDFDTRGKNEAAIKILFQQLELFQERLATRFNGASSKSGGRRIGRPRSLSSQDVKRAWTLVKQGQSLDAVAKQFHVSRATLYRYLEQIKRGIFGAYGLASAHLAEGELIFIVL